MHFYGAPGPAGDNARRDYAAAMVRELGQDALQIVTAVACEPGASDWDRAELVAIAAEIERLQLDDFGRRDAA
jgi:hypothetical protein